MKTFITTVGTSLLFNARSGLGLSALPDEAQMLHFLRSSDPVAASAESNTLSRLLAKNDHVVFLHSHTDEGKACAEVLRQFYQASDFGASSCEVTDLHYDQSRFRDRGLRALVAALCRLVRAARASGREAAIVATGGFKAEIAYATLVGLVMHTPVFYIHEKFHDVIEMPPTPISWDYGLLSDHEEFFSWIDAEPRSTLEVESRLKSLPGEARLLLTEDEDGCIFLSPTGEAFFLAYRELLTAWSGEPLYLSATARKAMQEATPSRRAEYAEILRKLRVPELRRTNSHSIQPSSDCLAYPSRHNATRTLYFEEGRHAYVCEILSKYDDSYERAYTRGVFRRDYGDFAPWDGNA